MQNKPILENGLLLYIGPNVFFENYEFLMMSSFCGIQNENDVTCKKALIDLPVP